MIERRMDLRNMYANRAIRTWLIWWSIRIIKTNAVRNKFYVLKGRFMMHVFEKQQNMTELIGLIATPTLQYHYEWIKHSAKQNLGCLCVRHLSNLTKDADILSNFSCNCANLLSPISNFHLSFMASFGFKGTAHQFYSIIGYFDREKFTATS